VYVFYYRTKEACETFLAAEAAREAVKKTTLDRKLEKYCWNPSPLSWNRAPI